MCFGCKKEEETQYHLLECNGYNHIQYQIKSNLIDFIDNILVEYCKLKIIDNFQKMKLIPLLKSWVKEDYFDNSSTPKINIFTGNWSDLLQIRIKIKVYRKIMEIVKSKKRSLKIVKRSLNKYFIPSWK